MRNLCIRARGVVRTRDDSGETFQGRAGNDRPRAIVAPVETPPRALALVAIAAVAMSLGVRSRLPSLQNRICA